MQTAKKSSRDTSVVYVATRANGNTSIRRRGESRDILLRLDLRMHSPTGFEWGFGGSGPAQAALAVLADYLGSNEEHLALALYQDFKWAVIARLPEQGWELTGEQIEMFLVQAEQLERV